MFKDLIRFSSYVSVNNVFVSKIGKIVFIMIKLLSCGVRGRLDMNSGFLCILFKLGWFVVLVLFGVLILVIFVVYV